MMEQLFTGKSLLILSFESTVPRFLHRRSKHRLNLLKGRTIHLIGKDSFKVSLKPFTVG